MSCTLLAQWDEGYVDPWLIITDLTPQQAQICWYGMRSWIECLFKDLKRGGFAWHHTKMTDPQRAERLWLAIAVATLSFFQKKTLTFSDGMNFGQGLGVENFVLEHIFSRHL
ncbi:MAG: hypothetical protein WBM44_13105 [Waterburya sp.]